MERNLSGRRTRSETDDLHLSTSPYSVRYRSKGGKTRDFASKVEDSCALEVTPEETAIYPARSSEFDFRSARNTREMSICEDATFIRAGQREHLGNDSCVPS